MVTPADFMISQEFELVTEFLRANPDRTPKKFLLQEALDERKLIDLATQMVNGRRVRQPSFAQTVSDPAVSIVVGLRYGVHANELMSVEAHHKMAMAAENVIGPLLEAYVAQQMGPQGWIWCSGDVVKAIDFLKKNDDGIWIALQIKNRDNSENSSSARVRDGTDIKKWYRTKSRTGQTNWEKFPDKGTIGILNEEGFISFIESVVERDL
ncbi:SinI family restriction endonuclease [Sandaracinobacter sp.]|uniref:SinI family restriction endonuclease n=1 Tax=Sandaracinobacter sp. TaxID=2487581 RepID=UPI0035B1DF22